MRDFGNHDFAVVHGKIEHFVAQAFRALLDSKTCSRSNGRCCYLAELDGIESPVAHGHLMLLIDHKASACDPEEVLAAGVAIAIALW